MLNMRAQLKERFEALRGWLARVFGLATPQMIKCDRCGTDTTAWTELEWTEYVGTRRGTIYGDSGWHNRVCVPCYKVIGDDIERAIASAISDSLWDAADDLPRPRAR